MRKWLAWLLVACLTCGFAAAEPDEAQRQRHEWVESMFRAAAGTTFEEEQTLRKDMTEEELAARNEALATYRAETEIWLLAAFDVSAEDEDAAPENEPASDASLNEAVSPIQTAWDRFSENEFGRTWLETLKALGAETAEDGIRISRGICAAWLNEIDSERLSKINADYACWIYAPDSPIDYPVVHGADNEHWLHRLFDGTRNAAGTLFVDSRNLPDFQDSNTLIYGHHMRNDSMFGSLDHYEQPGYYDAHPWMLIVAKNEIYLVDVIAGYTTSKKDHCYDIAISDAADKQAFLEEAIAKSDFASGTEIALDENLVTLSTCAYAFENARYIVIGKLLKTGKLLENGEGN